jgi:cytochrome c
VTKRLVAALLLASGSAAFVTATQDSAAGDGRGDERRGGVLIARYGCGGCHVIPGVQRAIGQVAPSLEDFHRRTYIAGVLPNTPEMLAVWIERPQAILPGIGMPNLDVSDSEAQAMAAYLRRQPDD